jgi:hypothetical protein
MEITAPAMFQDQLIERRRRLETARATLPASAEVQRLLGEVDAALKRDAADPDLDRAAAA